jgi:hypothetical protein
MVTSPQRLDESQSENGVAPIKREVKSSDDFIGQAMQLYEKGAPQSSAVEYERQKKLQKIRKAAIKHVLDSPNHKFFNLKYLLQWMQSTYNFAFWH